MWVADMAFRAPQPVLDALAQRLNHGILGYSLKPNTLLDSVCQWTKNQYNWESQPEWMCLSPGIVPALNICVEQYTQPGDDIIIMPPVYPPFFDAVEKRGRRLLLNPLTLSENRYTINFEQLRTLAASGAKMLILSNPHNPVGRAFTKDELQQIADICLEYQILILSDEIHADIVYAPNRHTPIASLSSEVANITITCYAPSKTFNLAGLTTSIILIPNNKLRDKFLQWTSSFHLENGNLMGLAAMDAAYRFGNEWLNALRLYLADNMSYFAQELPQRVEKLNVIPAEATFLAWIDCRKLEIPQQQLVEKFYRKAKLGFNDGQTFGNEGIGFMRINLANPRSIVTEALNRIEQAFA
jgi:cystathionine beta-lyase